MARAISGEHDRRGFDTLLKIHLGLAVVSLILLIFVNWKAGLALFLYACVAFINLEVCSAPPVNNPRNFSLWMRRRGNTRKPVLLCLGDSLTHGTMGANFTPDIPFKLSESLGLPHPTEGKFFFDPLWVVNAGQNCLTTHNVLTERLHSSMGCYPDFIMLMIGTNDVLSMHNSLIRNFYLKINQLPEAPSMQSFERNYTKILDHLWQSSPMSQVGVCTLPPLGENLDASENRLIREANDIIRKVVANANGKVKIIDIYEKFQAILEKKKGKGTAVNSFLPVFISQCPLYYMTPDFLNWNKLSSFFGNSLLTDGLHFNERGRDEVVEGVVDWLVNQANVAKAIAVKS